MNRLSHLPLILILGVGLTVGCNIGLPPGDGSGDPPAPAEDALADFSVADVNPESVRFQQAVSPRDYLGEVSAWYFGHST